MLPDAQQPPIADRESPAAPLTAAWEQFVRTRSRSRRQSLWIIAAVLGLVAIVQGFDPVSIVTILALFGVADVTTLLAMLATGYADARLLFLPIPVPATRRAGAAAGTARALVLLASPAALFMLAILAFIVTALTGGAEAPAVLLTFCLFFLAIALLPVFPCAGGLLLEILVFLRHPRLEVPVGAVAAGLATLAALSMGQWLLAVVGGLLLLGALTRGALVRSAHELRTRCGVLDPDPVQLSLEQRAALFDAASRFVPMQPGPGPDAAAVNRIAVHMDLLHARASRAPAGSVASLLLLGIYLVMTLSATSVLLLLNL